MCVLLVACGQAEVLVLIVAFVIGVPLVFLLIALIYTLANFLRTEAPGWLARLISRVPAVPAQLPDVSTVWLVLERFVDVASQLPEFK